MLKTTVLVDTDSCAVRDVYCSAHWPHNTQTGRRVVPRNTEKPESLAGDKGYDDQSLRDALRPEGVRLLLRHRLFAHYDHAHNVRLDSELYGQRWMAETASQPSSVDSAPLSIPTHGTASSASSC